MGTSYNQPTAEQCHASLIIENPELPLETLIEKQLRNLDPMSPDFCIYKVPLNLRQVNENAYTPEQVSIGPLHHGRNELQPWEKIKLRYLQAFLDHAKISLTDMVKVVKEWEGRARSYYREKIDLSSNEFVKMMIVDSCFIIEVIVRAKQKDAEVRNDFLDKPELIIDVRRDMILLENQVPFFVIEGLFDRGFGDDINAKFLDLSILYLYGTLLVTGTKDIVYLTKVVERVKRHIELGGIIEHIVDLLRICHLPSTQRVDTDRGKFIKIPTATELRKGGMKFRVGNNENLLDMHFSAGLLEMPRVEISFDSELVLRNVTALEAYRHPPRDGNITHYILFMDQLINTKEDVDLLVEKGIIVNWLGDNPAAASLFNELKKNIYFMESTYYYTKISQDIITYSNDTWHKWKKTLKRDYCSSPWKVASTVAAIILLFLTLVQTVCSLISLFRH